MSKVAPFNRDGNMVSYPEAWSEGQWGTPEYRRVGPDMREVPQFYAEMRVVGIERGQSAARMRLQDIQTGITYPLFLADLLPMLQEPVPEGTEFRVRGYWEACKRGQNYGIRKVQ